MPCSWSATPWWPRRSRGKGAEELAGAWTDALRERGWAGDEEVAAELEAALGRRPPLPGTALPVELDDVSELLEASLGEEGGRIDLQTGEVWRASTIEYFAETEPEEAPISRTRTTGCTWAPRVRTRATGTWRTSSPQWTMPAGPTASASPSRGAAPSGASRTRSPAGPTRRNAGIASQTNGGGDGPASGFRPLDIGLPSRAPRQHPDPDVGPLWTPPRLAGPGRCYVPAWPDVEGAAQAKPSAANGRKGTTCNRGQINDRTL